MMESEPQSILGITDGSQSEENLRKSGQLFRSIFENAQIGISFFKIGGRAVFSNRAFQDMLGYTGEELGRFETWDGIIHPDERASGAERYAELVQGKRDKDGWEQRFVRRDGCIVVANARFSLLRDAAGKPEYVASLTEDITERKRAQEERNRVTQQMEMLLESTGQGIYGVDLQGNCTFINRPACEMVGYRPEEALGRNMHDLVHHHKPDGSTYPVEECPVHRAIKKGEGCRSDTEVIWRRDGAPIPVEYSSFPILAGGTIAGAVVTVVDITERKRAEEKLRANEQLFRSIFENSQVGIGLFKIDDQEHVSNRALHEMLGYTGEELNRLGKWDEIVPAEERASCAQRYAELVQGKREKDEYEQHFIRRDGSVVLGNGRFQLLRDAAGNPQCIVGLTEDITERKRSQEALQASEQLFRSIFENAQIGISLYNVAKSQYFTNRALHEMLGCTHENLNSVEKWNLIFHAEDRASGAARYAELLAGKRDKDEWEQRFVRSDGEIVIADASFSVIRDTSGNPLYLLNMTKDITERRRAAEERERAMRLFQSVFENAQVGIGIYNIQTGEHTQNRSMHEILGYSQEELSRVELWDRIIHPDERELGAQRYSDLIQGKHDEDEWEQRFVQRDGQIVIANGRFRLLRDSAGKPQYIFSFNEDITRRKRVEAELVKAKESAEAATKSKSEFLANMSHEIRTPMNAVLGMTHLALKTELTPKQRDYLTKAKAAAAALLGIINDILDFSKIEAGKLKLEQTDFRLDVVLDNLSSVVSQRAHEKNLEFLVAAQPDLPAALVGDPLRLGQVLINLVNNAVKFTERGEIVVTVKLEERVSNHVKLKFAVRDSGIGMTSEQTARLFQAFSQADSSTTRKYGGTGLGLSISKRLVEMMEGSIWVESEYRRGSTFYFTAWFSVGSTERDQKALPSELTGARVLVVDDNVMGREILTDMLRRFTLRVESVSSGTDALRELANADTQDPYRLVLMDWQMPGLDGLEASRRIKRGGSLHNLPKILMITEFDREDIYKQGQNVEIEGVLQKPVSPSVLFDTLVSLFGAAREEKAPATVEKSDRDLPLANGIRVLLVEDNEVNQQVATELLESEGAKVTIANHGAEAVKILTHGNQPPPFDVVLMDLQMPEMDGVTATRLLRTEHHLQRLPIIAMTAHVMAEEIQRCLDAGMNDHIAKPIDPGAFFATLARWTRTHQPEVAELRGRAAGAADEITLPEIEGVDVPGGLRRIAGNKRLYRDLLTQFTAKQRSLGERIATAIESGDRHQAERLAHSLKGAAGNLGINQIFHLAGNLESAIRESPDDVEGMVRALASALDRQIQTIQEGLKVEAPIAGKPDAAGSVDPIAVSAAIARLKELLEASDADAPDAYTKLAEILQGTVAQSQVDALRAAINGFDFETALVKLNYICKEYGAIKK